MISVIVPVYNVEDYLHYAMEVWLSDLQGYEVLLIDDSSVIAETLVWPVCRNMIGWRSYHKVNSGDTFGTWGAWNPRATGLLPRSATIWTLCLGTASRATSRTQVDMVSGKVEPTANYNRFKRIFTWVSLIWSSVKVYDKASSDWDAMEIAGLTCGKLYRKSMKAPTSPKGRIYEHLLCYQWHLNQAPSVALVPSSDLPLLP